MDDDDNDDDVDDADADDDGLLRNIAQRWHAI
jgi:hypothetical protein